MTTPTTDARDATKTTRTWTGWLKNEKILLLILLALAVATWLPRLKGPIDLHWDGGVYYILGTSLAEGRGYKLLNEPGEIDAVQYPPLLPAIVAIHQLILGTSDPTIVGWWLRLTAFITFIFYIYVVFRFLKNYLSPPYAFLGSILCLFSLFVYFLSDMLFPEILFSLLTLLFILCSRAEESSRSQFAAYLCAVASYAIRTVGLAAFAAWVMESLVRRRFKQAMWRAVLVLIPILCWQFYIASVEATDAYKNPAYAYQRAPYLFYNVSYARNVALRDPFTPEKGDTSPIKMVRRFVRHAFYLLPAIGESVTTSRGYLETWLTELFGEARATLFIVSWSVFLVLNLIGIFTLGGLLLQLFRQQWIVPLYGFIYFAALCLTPFPGQYMRYLMPIVQLLVLALIIFLLATKDASRRFLAARWANTGAYLAITTLSLALLTEAVAFVVVYTEELQRVSYLDRRYQSVEHRLFFYKKSQQAFDEAITFIRGQAEPDDIIAAGTPHWIYLRTGLKTVMPPFEIDAAKAQQLLDSVPVSYLIVGQDVIGAERYTLPVVQQFTTQWKPIYTTPNGEWTVYQRANR